MNDQPEAENSGTQPPAPGGEPAFGGVLPGASGAGEPVDGVMHPAGAAAEPPTSGHEPAVSEQGTPVDPEPPAYEPLEPLDFELPAARTELPPPPPPSYPNYINPDAGLAPADEPDDLPLPKGRAPASTRYLSVALLLALAFGGGVAAQKHHDKGYTPPVSGAQAALAAGLAGGGGGGGAAAAAAAGGGAPGTLTFTPKVVGTITDVSGTDITVMGPDGVKHLVHTNAQTVVLRKGEVAEIKPGTVVAVDGTPDDAGVLTSKGIIAQ